MVFVSHSRTDTGGRWLVGIPFPFTYNLWLVSLTRARSLVILIMFLNSPVCTFTCIYTIYFEQSSVGHPHELSKLARRRVRKVTKRLMKKEFQACLRLERVVQ